MFITAVIFMTSCSSAGNPPEAVQKAFTKMFPTVTKVKWGKENATEYEAEFDLNGAEMSANFTSDGTWVETETEIEASQLPAAVSTAIEKQYSGWAIREAAKVESATKGLIYEADIKSGVQRKEVAFKEDGTSVE